MCKNNILLFTFDRLVCRYDRCYKHRRGIFKLKTMKRLIAIRKTQNRLINHQFMTHINLIRVHDVEVILLWQAKVLEKAASDDLQTRGSFESEPLEKSSIDRDDHELITHYYSFEQQTCFYWYSIIIILLCPKFFWFFFGIFAYPM